MAEREPRYLRALIYEKLIGQWLENQNWLGGEAKLTDVSEYDDWLNGVDFVVEFPGQPPVRLAIDFTTERDRQAIKARKLAPLFAGIESGQLAEIKYFRSQLVEAGQNPRQSLKLVPKVVVALSPETIEQVLKLTKSEQVGHWAKTVIALEIEEQLNFFSEYIRQPDRQGYSDASAQRLAAAYKQVKSKIGPVLGEIFAGYQKKGEKIKMPRPVDEALFKRQLIEKLKQLDGAFAALMDSLR